MKRSPPRPNFQQTLAREKPRQLRHNQGGRHADLADRLSYTQKEHDEACQSILTPSPKKQILSSDLFLKQYEETVQEICAGTHKKPCPFHKLIFLDSCTSKNNWKYYKCPVRGCPFFCAHDLINDWLEELSQQLHHTYKEKPTKDLDILLPFTCFCKHETYSNLKLGRNQSEEIQGVFI